MALKNDTDLSDFGKRLMGLMNEKRKTPPQVAEDLLDEGLVKVRRNGTRIDSGNADDLVDQRKSAVGAIVKKIRVHLKAKDASCLQGEFVMAYCKYFGCSADYLFGYTDVQTSDIDIKKVCKRSGLTEKAVTRLFAEEVMTPDEFFEMAKSYEGSIGLASHDWIGEFWSTILESDLLVILPFSWFQACRYQARKARAITAENAFRKAKNKSKGDEKEWHKFHMAFSDAIEEGLSNDSAIHGELFRMSKLFTDVIEKDIGKSCEPGNEMLTALAEENVKTIKRSEKYTSLYQLMEEDYPKVAHLDKNGKP